MLLLHLIQHLETASLAGDETNSILGGGALSVF